MADLSLRIATDQDTRRRDNIYGLRFSRVPQEPKTHLQKFFAWLEDETKDLHGGALLLYEERFDNTTAQIRYLGTIQGASSEDDAIQLLKSVRQDIEFKLRSVQLRLIEAQVIYSIVKGIDSSGALSLGASRAQSADVLRGGSPVGEGLEILTLLRQAGLLLGGQTEVETLIEIDRVIKAEEDDSSFATRTSDDSDNPWDELQ